MSSAKEKIREYLLQHVGENVSREELRAIAGEIMDWQRSLRQLRQETGLNIVSTSTGYILTSKTPVKTPKIRKSIDSKLRYAVLQRDNSTCQRCGANPYNKPNVKLVVDHKIPVDMGGETTMDNLWTLCSECNGGKQAFFRDDDAEVVKYIISLDSGYKRIKAYFESYPNKIIEPYKLQAISQLRDWERTLRLIRTKESMNIKWVSPNSEYPMGGYIYYK